MAKNHHSRSTELFDKSDPWIYNVFIYLDYIVIAAIFIKRIGRNIDLENYR